jgi:diguanylate cyclase
MAQSMNAMTAERRDGSGVVQAPTSAPHSLRNMASAHRAQLRRRAWLKECGIIALSYAVNGICLGLYSLTGTTHWSAGLAYVIPGWIVSGTIAVLIAQQYTVNFKDPSLATVQTVAAMVMGVVGMALYPEISFAYALFLFAVFLTPSYRMPMWQTNLAWLIVSLMSLVVTVGRGHTLHIPYDTHVEQLIAWLCFVVMLARCVLLSVINTNGTNLLRQRGKQMVEKLAQIERMATYDELTGVLNRRSLLRILGEEQARTDRGGSTTSVAIFDLDHFKVLNDTLGHPAGDKALQLFAASVQNLTRTTDFFGRYGGEEFLMILTDPEPDPDLKKAERAVERIRAGLAGVDWSGVAPGFKLTYSAGVASYRLGETAQQLLSRADQGLYAAKNDGRNCTRIG